MACLLAASLALTVALLFWSADSQDKIALANARHLAKTALSASLMALHGGDMRITSEVDQGTTVFLTCSVERGDESLGPFINYSV